MFDSLTNPWLVRCKVRFIDSTLHLLNCAGKTRQSACSLSRHMIDRRKQIISLTSSSQVQEPGYSAPDGGRNIARRSKISLKVKTAQKTRGFSFQSFFRVFVLETPFFSARVVLKRPATSRGSQGSLQKKKRLSKKDNGVKSRNENLQWLQEYKEERRGKVIGEARGIPRRKHESTRGNLC